MLRLEFTILLLLIFRFGCCQIDPSPGISLSPLNDGHDIDFTTQSLCIDNQGYMWIGTTNSLIRFNGYEFKKIIHDPYAKTSAPLGIYHDLQKDSNGNIWINASGFATCFNPLIERFIHHRVNAEPAEYIKVFDGNLVAFHEDRIEIYSLQGELLKTINAENNDKWNKIVAVDVVPEKGLYVLTSSNIQQHILMLDIPKGNLVETVIDVYGSEPIQGFKKFIDFEFHDSTHYAIVGEIYGRQDGHWFHENLASIRWGLTDSIISNQSEHIAVSAVEDYLLISIEKKGKVNYFSINPEGQSLSLMDVLFFEESKDKRGLDPYTDPVHDCNKGYWCIIDNQVFHLQEQLFLKTRSKGSSYRFESNNAKEGLGLGWPKTMEMGDFSEHYDFAEMSPNLQLYQKGKNEPSMIEIDEFTKGLPEAISHDDDPVDSICSLIEKTRYAMHRGQVALLQNTAIVEVSYHLFDNYGNSKHGPFHLIFNYDIPSATTKNVVLSSIGSNISNYIHRTAQAAHFFYDTIVVRSDGSSITKHVVDNSIYYAQQVNNDLTLCHFKGGSGILDLDTYSIDTIHRITDSVELSSHSNFVLAEGRFWWNTRKTLYSWDKASGMKEFDLVNGAYQLDKARLDDILAGNLFDKFDLTYKEGRLFIATLNSGLICFDIESKNWYRLNESNFLSSNSICKMLEVNNSIWLIQPMGVTKVSPLDFSSYLFKYDNGKTIRPQENYWGNLKSENGTFKIPVSNGIITSHLNDITGYRQTQSKITSITIKNAAPISPKSLKDLASLELEHDQNEFRLSFLGLELVHPENCRYAYRLQGYDNDWNYIQGKVPQVRYTNLSPGSYTLEMRSSTPAGKWGPTRKITIEINPPWWEKWYAYTGYVICLIFAFTIFYRWRTTSLRKRQQQLESTVRSRTKELESEKQRAIDNSRTVEEKNKEILDSINYAKRLQHAILPGPKVVKEHLGESFILYKPKDIVAGDFYWLEVPPKPKESYSSKAGMSHSEGEFGWTYIAVADCTGHGVPGAMVSVVCSNALSKALIEENITDTGKLLDRTRELVIERFGKSDDEIKDGMDISLAAIRHDEKQVRWSGANNPLWIIKGEGHTTESSDFDLLQEVKPDKQPIGKYAKETPFTQHIIDLEAGDALYLFSDGYADQFGGDKGKKFKSGRLKKLLVSIQDKSMEEQKLLLDETFESWRGEVEQIDDVCVIGLRFPLSIN